MAIVKVPKKEIEKYVKLTEENIERMNLMGIPIESIRDEEIEVEVMPNRPDALSIQGYLRALKAYFGKESGLKKYKLKKPEKNYEVKVDCSLKDIRPYTACAIIKNLKFDDEKIKEIIDIQEKMHSTVGRNRKKVAIGIYPLEKISLPIKFEAIKPKEIRFVPLDSEREMNGLEILQSHPKGREYAHLLEGMEKFPVFKDQKGKILSMPPIINSNDTGKISESTTEIFIECSGSDFEILQKTLNIIATVFAEMGGTIYQMEVNYGKKEITPDLTPSRMKISLENANKLLGLSLKEKDLEALLPKMGYDYHKGYVKIPAWRMDILHEVDIIEDIAIAYGYDRLEPEIPKIATVGEESKESRLRNIATDILTGLGLIEASSYHLIKDEEIKFTDIKDRIELENSKTEYKFLRSNLLIPILRIISENKDKEYPQRIFEIGTVFLKEGGQKTETGIAEKENLIVAYTPGNFTELKEALEYLFKMLGTGYSVREGSKKGFIEGRTGEILFGGKSIGYIGEIHPDTLRAMNLKLPCTVFEISLNEILEDIYG